MARDLPVFEPTTDPMALFRDWYQEAVRAGIFLPEAMALSAATPDGCPSVRFVLFKDLSPEGFSFYTNTESRKARELAENPRVALAFHWSLFQRQVRVEGVAAPLPAGEVDAYFRTRRRGSRIGAWASHQSEPIASRAALMAAVREVDRRFPGDGIPVPPHWGGYRVWPERIEFWQGRLDRLHDRFLYSRAGSGWQVERLQP
jgi:pyridoxamine 5'-phosphate oxidase